MTSSDQTALGAGAMEALARRVGASHSGLAHQAASSTAGVRIALVGAKFNGGITERLMSGALDAFDALGVDLRSVSITWVPGAFEIPVTAQRLIETERVNAVVALGAVIRGETAHFDFVAGECASGCRQVGLSSGVPVVFGVLTTENVQQALDRCAPDKTNRGYEAAVTALEMIDVLERLDERSELPSAPGTEG